MKKKVLFVCSFNMDRSPTGEDLLKGKDDFEVKSAGTSRAAVKVVSAELVNWADVIFAMEEKHKEALIAVNPRAEEKTIVLGIEDNYARGDPRLIRMLTEKLSKYLGKLHSGGNLALN
jgi:predicted protein tyrosine phosphatase